MNAVTASTAPARSARGVRWFTRRRRRESTVSFPELVWMHHLRQEELRRGAHGAKSVYFYILFAFAAGFSERLAQDMLLGPTVQAAAARAKPPRTTPAEEQPPVDQQGLDTLPTEES